MINNPIDISNISKILRKGSIKIVEDGFFKDA